MIQTKILDTNKYKNIDDLAKDLENMANYEGWMIVTTLGKKNNLILFQRVLEQQQQQIPNEYQQPQIPNELSPPTRSKSQGNKKSSARFPNAVHQ